MANIKSEVLKFMEDRNPIPGSTEQEKLGCHYLDSGVIDSLGIVEMITVFEDKFGIRFENDHLQSSEFQTVGGLIQLIEGLAQRK